MQISQCGQFNPRAGKIDPCSGVVYQVKILWEKAVGYVVDPTRPKSAGIVCDGHMKAFEELGQRDEFKYSIVKDEVISEIAPQSIERKSSAKEME